MPRHRIEKPGEPEVNARLRRHIGDLGFSSFSQYQEWCRARGFAPSARKSAYDLDAERERFVKDKARAAELARLGRNPVKLIERICSGTLAAKDVTRPALAGFCLAVEKSDPAREARESLCRLLLRVETKAGFVFGSRVFGGRESPYIAALIALNNRRAQWIAPPGTWRPPSHNAAKSFSSLARHLLARYPVPEFMDEAWFRTGPNAARFQDWFVHIGAGKNIRTADTPVPLTKLMAHHFLQAPADFTIEGAIRWGQVHALGGDARLVQAVLGSHLGGNFENDEFWVTVIRFFAANPLLDRRHVAPIIDYLYNQRFATRVVYRGRGAVEHHPPPQPNLSMRGRTAAGLLAQVERWHRDLGRAKAAGNLVFKRSGFKPFERRTGRDGENVWTIRELLSGAELIAEGRAMRHCVATYARSCAMGRCSIWSMEFSSPMGTEKRQTIEVLWNATIVQCRGRANRLPDPREFNILKAWAQEAGLTIAGYVQCAS